MMAGALPRGIPLCHQRRAAEHSCKARLWVSGRLPHSRPFEHRAQHAAPDRAGRPGLSKTGAARLASALARCDRGKPRYRGERPRARSSAKRCRRSTGAYPVSATSRSPVRAPSKPAGLSAACSITLGLADGRSGSSRTGAARLPDARRNRGGRELRLRRFAAQPGRSCDAGRMAGLSAWWFSRPNTRVRRCRCMPGMRNCAFRGPGITRLGTLEPLYDGRARNFVSVDETRPYDFRVMPRRFAAYLAVRMRWRIGRVRTTGPLS